MPRRPNPIPTMLKELEVDENVAALCVDKNGLLMIFGGKVPPFVVDAMPTSCVVLTQAGGWKDTPYLPVHSYRIQATCYGGGRTPDASNELEASLVASAVADALDGRNNIYDQTTVIKSIQLVGGPTQIKDVDMNDTPAEVLFFRVLAPTVQLTPPY